MPVPDVLPVESLGPDWSVWQYAEYIVPVGDI